MSERESKPDKRPGQPLSRAERRSAECELDCRMAVRWGGYGDPDEKVGASPTGRSPISGSSR